MARSVGSGQTIISANTIPTGAGNLISTSGWVNINAGFGSTIRACWRAVGGGGSQALYVNSTNFLSWYSAAGMNDSTFTPVAGAWFHFVTVGTLDNTGSTHDGILYVNGVSTLTGVNIDSWGTPINWYMGSDPFSQPLNGSIADYALWIGVKLTALEALGLSKGQRPGSVRPGNIQIWCPIDGNASPEPDLSGHVNNGNLTGTSKTFGPPITMFTPRWSQFNFPAAAPTFNAAWAIGKNTVIEGVAT